MSEHGEDDSLPQRNEGDINFENSLDESANNSIIDKMKSRVSSILPNRLSKWFSPSTKLQNESCKATLNRESSTQWLRRKRYLEVEEDGNYDDVRYCGEFNDNINLPAKQECDVDDENDNDADDDSQNNDYQYSSNAIKQRRRDLNIGRQPPEKRSRLNIEVCESPTTVLQQPLLSSTPDASFGRLRDSYNNPPASRYNYQRYTHLNLYGNQTKKDPAFNFGQQRDARSATKNNTDIIDLITNTSYEHDNLAYNCNLHDSRNSRASSRKNLNIPCSTSILQEPESSNISISHLKRQPLSSAKADSPATEATNVPPRRTSTTINEVKDQEIEQQEKNDCEVIEKREVSSSQNSNAYNGCNEVSNSLTNKRQKLINGASLSAIAIPESNEVISVDSASESGDSAIDVIKLSSPHTQQRKGDIFNMSVSANTRNNSRTSSIGNGLNFYSHLEGRKSLFSGSNHGYSYPINNSTLSLTSLNRRQFNASIYGSTSALSDSRLLNTFSPFYKGKTTYGGAAAYNKYTAGANAVRITPTLIRPSSSLSNFSGNSLTNNANFQGSENSAISSTAKRILDLINDFATPLSDAKKMAGNLKTNSVTHIQPQAKARLNEHDLNESRSIRLSQVRTPYSRPAVILQPSGNASGRGPPCTTLPPVKELQVPTMSQLLQMKKMQNTTEKVRKITQKTELNAEYSLPELDISKKNSSKAIEKDKQKHTNKVRNKITKSLRSAVSAKNLQDEEPPPPVNLPNIAFPVMQSVPKIDIQLNKPIEPCKTTTELQSSKLPIATETPNDILKDSSKPALLAFNFSQETSPIKNIILNADNKQKKLDTIQSNSTVKSFIFSEPLQVFGDILPCQNITQNEKDEYQFSPPLDIVESLTSKHFELNKTQTKVRHLKEGSCLDALKKPFSLPSTISEYSSVNKTSVSKIISSSSTGFGSQFKNSSNEWECDVCLVRNKLSVDKCVACETPNKQNTLQSQPAIKSSYPSLPSIGQQFKKQSNEWDCDACMVRNKEEATKCIACETRRKSAVVKLPAATSSFGAAFMRKSDAWVCQTCMISNKNEINACAACQTEKPGSTNTSHSAIPSSQFNFGFADANKTNSIADAGFKTIAAQQKVSKWECDACMTRNDANRTKCACCEQPKPGISNAGSTSATSTKFEFGATAASKFSFGFGTGPSGSKEEDIRKELADTPAEVKKPTSTTFDAVQLTAAQGGFQFGFKPAINSTVESKTDLTDSKRKVAEPQADASTSSVVTKVSEKPTVASTTAIGLESGPKILSSTVSPAPLPTQTKSSAASVSTSSVKFSLPSTSNATKDVMEKGVTLPVFGFGTGTALSTTGGFSFGSKVDGSGIESAEKPKTSSASVARKEQTTMPPTFALAFPTTNTSAASFVSSTLNTTAAATTIPTTSTAITTSTVTAVKPVFSFGMNTSNVSSVKSQSSPAMSSFVFGGNATNNVAVTTTANILFGAVTSTSTVTSTTNLTTTKTSSTLSTGTTAPASTNIFGSFSGGDTSKASSLPIFGSSVNSPANTNLSSVSSSTKNPTTSNTPQFGSFGSKSSSNVFGSFGGIGNSGTKKTALETQNGTMPAPSLFGNDASNNTQLSQLNTTGFVFGSKNVNNTTVVTTTTGSVTSTSTWPKRSFVFGSNASLSPITPAQTNKNESKETGKTSVFGTFDSNSTNSSSLQQTSIFGVPTSNAASSLTPSVTSAAGPTSFSTNLFNTNSPQAATSIFGANSSGNAATPTPAFGSSPFGGAASSTSATPTFGVVPAASGTTFGSFGGSTISTTANTTEVKKPETAFNFGTAAAAQSTSGGFNFGASASTTKPAFNFGGASTSQQPTFNFTGSAENQSSTKPFQFGAIPSAPVFNFNRGVLEATPTAPFQFNAGAAPVSSNIFAPTPTAGTQTAQQAKRKIRAPTRRVTQR